MPVTRATLRRRAQYCRRSSPGGQGSATVWVEDSVPTGAVQVGTVDAWTWVSSNPAQAFSGSRAHQSALASGIHQHYFYGATATMAITPGDTLLPVSLPRSGEPAEPESGCCNGTTAPGTIALTGAPISFGYGVDGTVSRRSMGPLSADGSVGTARGAGVCRRPRRTHHPRHGLHAVQRPRNMGSGGTHSGGDFYRAGRRQRADGRGAGRDRRCVDVGQQQSCGVLRQSRAWVAGACIGHSPTLLLRRHRHDGRSQRATRSTRTFTSIRANPPSEVDAAMERWHLGPSRLLGCQFGWVRCQRNRQPPLNGTGPPDRTVGTARGAAYPISLEGRVVHGMAFTLYNGRAEHRDQAGKF